MTPTRRDALAVGMATTLGLVEGAAPPAVDPRAWIGKVTAMAFGTPGEVDRLADMGVEVLHTNVVWPYYPLRRDGGGLSRVDHENLSKLVRSCRRRGMRLSLGLPPFMPVALVRRHPAWREHPDDTGRIVRVEPNENDLGTRSGCNHGPWGDYLIEVCCELARDYDLDGFSFDGNYHPPLCYCPSCKSAYRTEHALELPRRIDMRDETYRRYLVWRGGKLVEHYTRMKRRLQEVRPGTALMSWTVNAGRFGHFLHSPRAMPIEVNRVFDVPMQEWWLEESNLGASVVPAFGTAYLRAVAGDGPCASEPYLMSRADPATTDSFPHHERMARAMLALTHGSLAAHSIGWVGHRESTGEIFAEVRRRAAWLTGTKRLAWAGLVVSEQTRQFVHVAQIRDRFLPPVLGCFRAMLEEHLPVSLLSDLELSGSGLAPYRVLLLPEVVALSAEQVRAIRAFVEAGGGVVASGETSLADELGRPRKDFALRDLFGVSHRGREERTGRFHLTDRAGFSDPRLGRLVPGGQVGYRGALVQVSEPARGELAAHFTREGEKPWPALIRRRLGKGRVVYLAAGIDAALWNHAYPYQRILLAEAIRWAAAEPPPVTVQGPMCVQMSCFQRGSATTIVHLFNNVVTTAHHGKPTAEVPLREETLPIHDLRVIFAGKMPRRCTLQPGGRALRIEPVAGQWGVVVPRLELHAMVVAEFGV